MQEPLRFIVEAADKPMSLVKVCITVVIVRNERIRKAQEEGLARVGECRAKIVLRPREGVSGGKRQTLVTEIVAVQRGNQGVVIRVAQVGARIDAGRNRVEPSSPGGPVSICDRG